jgi:hypothetical protein
MRGGHDINTPLARGAPPHIRGTLSGRRTKSDRQSEESLGRASEHDIVRQNPKSHASCSGAQNGP